VLQRSVLLSGRLMAVGELVGVHQAEEQGFG
jgi:hypothetical protein